MRKMSIELFKKFKK